MGVSGYRSSDPSPFLIRLICWKIRERGFTYVDRGQKVTLPPWSERERRIRSGRSVRELTALEVEQEVWVNAIEEDEETRENGNGFADY
jgi:hypothetical protein